MLTTSLKTPRTLEHDRSGLAGPHLEACAGWLDAQRSHSRRILQLLRGAPRFSCGAHSAGRTMPALDAQALDASGHHLHGLQRRWSPSGRSRHLVVGARHVVRFLETTGVVAPATSILPPPPAPALLGACRRWMQTHRGTTQAPLNGSRLTIMALLHTRGDQPERVAARALRAFVLARAGHGGIGRAQTGVTAVRMLLRFLIAIGRCPPGLDHALPTMAHWRLASLPKSRPAETLERVLATCDLATPIGVRDRAVLWLLARLGLRAGDVAAWRWGDSDGHDGTLGVVGTSRRATRLP